MWRAAAAMPSQIHKETLRVLEAWWIHDMLCCCDLQLDREEQLELWGLLANMLAVDELVPGQLLGHVDRAVAAGQQRLARHHYRPPR